MDKIRKGHILSLPQELLEMILSYLTYSDLHRILVTCRTFNTSCRRILSLELSRVVTKLDAIITMEDAVVRSQRGADGDSTSRLNTMPKHRHARGNLVVLAGLVRTAQTCSTHQVRAGEFPPLPAQFLADATNIVEDAINDAVKRMSKHAVQKARRYNPLIRYNELKMIFNSVIDYFEVNVRSAKRLSPLAMFRTVVDVLAGLPGEAGTLVRTADGIMYSKPLPWVRMFMPPTGPGSKSDRLLLLKLVQLGLRTVSHHVRTDQEVLVKFEPFWVPSTWRETEHTETVKGVRLEAACPWLEEAPNLQWLRTAVPSHFRVTFVVFRYQRFASKFFDMKEELEEFSHEFKICSDN